MNLETLDKLGLNEEIFQKIDSSISDKDLKEILKRDLKENALSLITNSFKASLILSVSIVESCMLSKIYDLGITKYKPSATAKKDKKVTDMTLSELLYVVEQNKIINTQTYHFSQAIRDYRNLVHSAAEVKKGKIKKITESDAELAWGITKKIIYDI